MLNTYYGVTCQKSQFTGEKETNGSENAALLLFNCFNGLKLTFEHLIVQM